MAVLSNGSMKGLALVLPSLFVLGGVAILIALFWTSIPFGYIGAAYLIVSGLLVLGGLALTEAWPVPGAVVAILGCAGMAGLVWWTVIVPVLPFLVAVYAVLRARRASSFRETTL